MTPPNPSPGLTAPAPDVVVAPVDPMVDGILGALPVLDQMLQPAPDGLSREQVQTRVQQALRAEIRAELRDELIDQLTRELRAELEPKARAEAEAQQLVRWQNWLRDECPHVVQQHIQASQQDWVACISQGILQQAPQWAEALQSRVQADLQQHISQSLPELQAGAQNQLGHALHTALLVPEAPPPV